MKTTFTIFALAQTKPNARHRSPTEQQRA